MRNATAAQTGYCFQDCAGIVLFFDHIKEIDSIRFEGSKEDIELNLKDGTVIFSQAKYCDLNSQRERAHSCLLKSLLTLSEADSSNCSNLIYVTNIIRPLGSDISSDNFGQPDITIHFDDLTDEGKEYIDNLLQKNDLHINPLKLTFRIIAFHGSESRSRHKVIYDNIGEFLSKFNKKYNFDIDKLLSLILEIVSCNKTEKNLSVTLSKNDIVWVIIEQILSDIGSELDDFDEATRSEIESMYKDIISYHQERIDFTSRVIYDFNKWRGNLPKNNETIRSFISSHIDSYDDEFEDCEIDSEIKVHLVSIILSKILGLRLILPKIKEASGIVD